MKQKEIFIICSDEEYVANIESKLAESINSEYSLEIITNDEYLKKYAGKMYPIDTLFIEEKMEQGIADYFMPERLFILTEKESEDENLISKYDAAQGIMRVLGKKYISIGQLPGKNGTSVINIISACGGSGKTITALGVAKQLAMLHHKVIYLDIENIQNFYECMGEKEEKYADEKTALLFLGKDEVSFAELYTMIVHGEFDFFPAFGRALSAYHLDEKAYYYFADWLIKNMKYDYIVMEHAQDLTADSIKKNNTGEKLIITGFQTAQSVERIKKIMLNIQDYSQCVFVCTKYEQTHADELTNYALQKDIPVCERISWEAHPISLQDVEHMKLYRSTAEAVE